MQEKIRFMALLIFLASSLHGQWRKVQLDDGDMAADLSEALGFQKYPTYPQYVEIMQLFAQSHPDICRLDTFGTSSQGRLLLAMKISRHVEEDEAEASFLFTSSMHGDELVGYPLMLRLINHLLSGYGTDVEVGRLLDGLAIWINPLANPDGTYYPDDDLSVAYSRRETADGTDMNREFPDPLYGETVNDTAGRAQETKAMMSFLQEHRFSMSANIHSGAEVVNYPWDHTDALHADDSWFRFVSREYADEARSVDPAYMSLFEDGITNGAQWYKINGGRQDFVNYYLEGRELTLELANEFHLESELLDEYWMKNERSFMNYMAQCLYGIRGKVSDSKSGLPLEARIEIPGHDEPYSVVHSSPVHGDFYRLLEEGNYDVVISSGGYIPDTITMVQVENYQAGVLDVKLDPIMKSAGPAKRERALLLYPNPASDKCLIYPEIDPGSPVQLNVYTINGVKIMEQSLFYDGQGIEIQTGAWAEGLYLVRCLSDQANSMGKLIIQ